MSEPRISATSGDGFIAYVNEEEHSPNPASATCRVYTNRYNLVRCVRTDGADWTRAEVLVVRVGSYTIFKSNELFSGDGKTVWVNFELGSPGLRDVASGPGFLMDSFSVHITNSDVLFPETPQQPAAISPAP
jgi:hypothetical protein